MLSELDSAGVMPKSVVVGPDDFDWGSDRPLLLRLPRILLSSAVMAGFLWFTPDWLSAWLTHDALFVHQAMALGAMVIAAMAIYFGLAFATGGADIGMIRRNVRRG